MKFLNYLNITEKYNGKNVELKKRIRSGIKAALIVMFLLLSFTSCSASPAERGESSENRDAENLETEEQSQKTDGLSREPVQDNDNLENNDIQEEKTEASESGEKDISNGENDTLDGEDPDGDLESDPPVKEIFIDKLTEEGKGWGLGFGEPGTQPVGNASVQELAQYDAYFMGNDSDQVIYLTFDCGYENGNTEPILDALKKHSVPATFFVVGNRVPSWPGVLKRAFDMGCEIGNHTYDHKILTKTDVATIQSQINGTNAAVQSITGVSPAVMRPPGGGYNGTVSAAVGMPIILWSIDTLDWKTRNPLLTQASVLNHVQNGDIILMHDLYSQTAAASGVIIPELRNRGYQLVTVSELSDCRGAMSNGSVYHAFP